MKIISYNVNGIRAALRKDLDQWLAEVQPDVLCIQETKAQPEQVDCSFAEELGYHVYWHSAERKGYSGLVTLSKRPANFTCGGCGIERYDVEGRVLRTDFDDWTLLNCYFPNGTSGDLRQGFKYEFLDDFYEYAHELRKERNKLIIVGDYNIAHTEIDIHNPKGNQKNSGFLPEEREWMSKWFDSGFTDAFRQVHPEKIAYSWWSFRFNARKNNKGWRIDYQSVSDNLKENVQDVRHLADAVHSDHCPVLMEIDL